MTKLGIVGTAKNTGKTTTFNAILSEAVKSNTTVALTSIGYDGEDIDNITFLPKPRILVRENNIIATSELCLKTSKAKFEIIQNTNVKTPLGEIFIIKVIEPGEIVLAGPNSINMLKKILNLLEQTNPSLIMIDGALNRIAPMFLVDKIIFTTGASRDISIKRLCDEIKVVSFILNLKTTNNNIASECITLIKNKPVNTKIISILTDEDLINLLNYDYSNVKSIYIPNFFSISLFKKFLETIKQKELLNKDKKIKIIFPEPFRLLLALNSIEDLLIFTDDKFEFYLLKKPELIAVTINPFYPKYENYTFKAEYIDKDLLLSEMKKIINIPVYNILEDGAKMLFNKVFN